MPPRLKQFVNKYATHGLFSGDFNLLNRVLDYVKGVSKKPELIDYTEAPNIGSPPLGHICTTCHVSSCCMKLPSFFDEGPAVACVAALRSCSGGHFEYVWNMLEHMSGHCKYVEALKLLYEHQSNEDLVRCAVMVCTGDVIPFESKERRSNELDYLWIVPKIESRPIGRKSEEYMRGEPLDVAVPDWKEIEHKVSVLKI